MGFVVVLLIGVNTKRCDSLFRRWMSSGCFFGVIFRCVIDMFIEDGYE